MARQPSTYPLAMFNGESDCVSAKLRPGNVHRAEDWEELPVPEVNRQLLLGKEVVFRADAAFPKPEIYEALEERGVKYAIRMPANDSLERDIAELLTRPMGRPSHKPVVWHKGFLYQATSWKTARRQSRSTPSSRSLEKRIMLLFGGQGHILTQVRDKTDIPVNDIRLIVPVRVLACAIVRRCRYVPHS